jgi:hypothetical protein
MVTLQAETRITMLRLCALLENGVEKTNNYIERYRRIAEKTDMPRITEIIDNLQLVRTILAESYATLCSSDAPSHADLVRIHNIVSSYYNRVIIMGSSLLPAAVRQIYYEIHRTLAALTA